MKNLSYGLLGIFILSLMLISPCRASTRQDHLLVYDQGLVSLQAATLPLVILLERLAEAACVDIYLTDKITNSSVAADFVRIPFIDVLDSLLRGYSYAVVYSKSGPGRHQVYLNADQRPGGIGVEIAGKQDGAPIDKATPSKGRRPGIKGSNQSFRDKENLSRSTNVRDPAGPGYGKNRTGADTGRGGYVSGGTAGTASVTPQEMSSVFSYASDETGTAAPEIRTAVPAFDNGFENMTDEEAKVAKLEMEIKSLEEEIDSGRADRFYSLWSSVKDSRYVYNHREDLATKQQELSVLQGN